ncbi:unnamed protein product [Closterium sp. NIES-65]|nr:unnamed protein product [Closterium sp. NIES-65]
MRLRYLIPPAFLSPPSATPAIVVAQEELPFTTLQCPSPSPSVPLVSSFPHAAFLFSRKHLLVPAALTEYSLEATFFPSLCAVCSVFAFPLPTHLPHPSPPHTTPASHAAFLFSREYLLAMAAALTEYALETALFPAFKRRLWPVAWVGGALLLAGEAVRKAAMVTAGRSFTHDIQTEKRREHRLVTHGLYRWVWHPGYTGWFMWSIATQLLLVNPLCTLAFALVSWRFFAVRIPHPLRVLPAPAHRSQVPAMRCPPAFVRLIALSSPVPPPCSYEEFYLHQFLDSSTHSLGAICSAADGSGSAAEGSGLAAEGSGLAAEGSGLAAGELEFRRVECAGRYDDARSLFVGPRAHTVRGAQEKGYFLVTPLIPPSGRCLAGQGCAGEGVLPCHSAHASPWLVCPFAPSVKHSSFMPMRAHTVRGAQEKGYFLVTPLLPRAGSGMPRKTCEVLSLLAPIVALSSPGSVSIPRGSEARAMFLPSAGLAPHLMPPHLMPPHLMPPHLMPPHLMPPHRMPPHLMPPQPAVLVSRGQQPAVLVNRGWVPEAVRREADTWMAGERARGAAGEVGKEEVESGGSRTSRSGGGGSSSSGRSSSGDVSVKGSSRGWFGSGGGKGRASTKAETAGSEPNTPPIIRVSGVVRGSEKPNHFVPPNAPEHGKWFWVDVAAMAQGCGLPRGTLLLDAMKPTEEEEENTTHSTGSSNSSSGQAGVCPAFSSDPRFPRPKDPEELVKLPVMPTDHITYAATW